MKNILCFLGIHDWENLNGIWQYGGAFSKVDRVCLRCGKMSLELTNFYDKQNKENLKLEDRKQISKHMADSVGYVKPILKHNR